MAGRNSGKRAEGRKALKVEIAKLSPAEREAINAMRSPSERLADPNTRCGARLREDPDRKGDHTTCRNRAGEGTDHPGYGNCKFHGGLTEAGRKSAARSYGRDLIAKEKERFGGDRSLLDGVSPEEALLEEVRRSVAMVRFLEDAIAKWQMEADPDSAHSPTSSVGGLPRLVDETSRGAASFTDEREWLMLYREERKHAATVSSLAINAGLAERMVRIAEKQGEVLATVIETVLSSLALTPQQQALVPQIVPTIIRQAANGQPIDVSSLPALAS